MQLTCPACGARYDIDDRLVPPEGRSVQCSVCDHVWREAPPGSSATEAGDAPAEEAKPKADASAEPPAAGSAPPERPAAARPPIADEVRAILREEADRESRVRRERGLVQIRPDSRLSPGGGPARRRPASRGLADPEKINETLRAAARRTAERHGAQRRRPGRGGFLAGLLVGLCIVALAAAVYAAAPALSEAVPDLEPTLRAYVGAVDAIRLELDRAAARLIAAVSDLVE